MQKSAMKECCLLDMTWPLHPWVYCSYGYPYKTRTRSSQQGQPTFQQAVLIKFNGCGTVLSSKQNNHYLHQTAASAKNITAGTVDIPSKEEGMGRTIRPSTQCPVTPPSRLHADLPYYTWPWGLKEGPGHLYWGSLKGGPPSIQALTFQCCCFGVTHDVTYNPWPRICK